MAMLMNGWLNKGPLPGGDEVELEGRVLETPPNCFCGWDCLRWPKTVVRRAAMRGAARVTVKTEKMRSEKSKRPETRRFGEDIDGATVNSRGGSMGRELGPQKKVLYDDVRSPVRRRSCGCGYACCLRGTVRQTEVL